MRDWSLWSAALSRFECKTKLQFFAYCISCSQHKVVVSYHTHMEEWVTSLHIWSSDIIGRVLRRQWQHTTYTNHVVSHTYARVSTLHVWKKSRMSQGGCSAKNSNTRHAQVMSYHTHMEESRPYTFEGVMSQGGCGADNRNIRHVHVMSPSTYEGIMSRNITHIWSHVWMSHVTGRVRRQQSQRMTCSLLWPGVLRSAGIAIVGLFSWNIGLFDQIDGCGADDSNIWPMGCQRQQQTRSSEIAASYSFICGANDSNIWHVLHVHITYGQRSNDMGGYSS